MILNSVIGDKSFQFAVRIVALYKQLTETKEFVLSKQLLKSGTSIGANVTEANGAISKADFSSKISIAYKEALETKYWLRLLKETDYINESVFVSHTTDLEEICKILYAILKKTRLENIK